MYIALQNLPHCNEAGPAADWRVGDDRMMDSHGYYLEDMSVGMTAAYSRTVTEADVVLFAGVSGDVNPLHLDHEFAKATMFRGRIAHGLLTASFISTALGNKLPGPGCVYVSQNLKFKAPVRVGDTVRAQVTVTHVDVERCRVKVGTVCRVGDIVVIDGDAELLVLRRPALQAVD